MLSAGSIETEVNNAETLYEQSHSWKESYPFDPVYKVPSTLYMVAKFACKWFEYPSDDLGHPICDWTQARNNGPEGGTSFMDFW